MDKKRGKQSFLLPNRPVITHWASIAGKKEGEGPLAPSFDIAFPDSHFGQPTWEQGEKRLQQLALETLIGKAGIGPDQIDTVCSGDLLNQCIGSSFSLRNMGIPHLGLYGAFLIHSVLIQCFLTQRRIKHRLLFVLLVLMMNRLMLLRVHQRRLLFFILVICLLV